MWYESTWIKCVCVYYVCIHSHTHTCMKEIFLRGSLRSWCPGYAPNQLNHHTNLSGGTQVSVECQAITRSSQGCKTHCTLVYTVSSPPNESAILVGSSNLSWCIWSLRKESPRWLTAKELGAFCWGQGIRTVSAASMTSPEPSIPGGSEAGSFCLSCFHRTS